jgi:hypothetical protein
MADTTTSLTNRIKTGWQAALASPSETHRKSLRALLTRLTPELTDASDDRRVSLLLEKTEEKLKEPGLTYLEKSAICKDAAPLLLQSSDHATASLHGCHIGRMNYHYLIEKPGETHYKAALLNRLHIGYKNILITGFTTSKTKNHSHETDCIVYPPSRRTDTFHTNLTWENGAFIATANNIPGSHPIVAGPDGRLSTAIRAIIQINNTAKIHLRHPERRLAACLIKRLSRIFPYPHSTFRQSPVLWIPNLITHANRDSALQIHKLEPKTARQFLNILQHTADNTEKT